MNTDEHTLLQLEDDLPQVVIRRDAALLERLMDDGHVFTNAVGEVRNKLQTLGKYQELLDKARFDVIANSDVRVRIYVAAAVVTGTQSQRGNINWQAISGTYRFTALHVLRAGAWRCAAQHDSSDAPIWEI